MEQAAAVAAIGAERDFGTPSDRERFLLRPIGMLLFANAEPGTHIASLQKIADGRLSHKSEQKGTGNHRPDAGRPTFQSANR
jgi:hypothetical protein